ncbi:MAG TPA: tetratricopeptide repeat protein [Bryobacteraceae bacterium]|jgi:predicted CXXCH cytochrome family protein|nr:tetratricopeptide repeat protein [Bryobacteraceae bacterium]
MFRIQSNFAVVYVLAGFSNVVHAQQVCAQCHPREAENYARSAMARSSGTPEGQPGGRVVHKPSGSIVIIRSDAPGMTHTLEEAGLKAQYRVPYYIGAGIVGRSYLVRIGEYLFQSPASYYTHTNGWDLTPGYETERRLDFDHEIVAGCLFCHTGSVNLIGSSANRYQKVPFTPISCERCHGPGAAHVQAPSAQNIVNPAKAEPRARDSVCEQCHLEGVTRILNPGKDWWDFRAGQELEKTFSVYLENDASGVKAVSHVEQLVLSKCARMSGGRLWCGTCHDPHGDAPRDRASQVKAICTSCHSQLSAASHPGTVEQCTSCHMPARGASDVVHAAVTDHRILRRPELQLKNVSAEVRAPTAWHNPSPPLDQRNLGLATLAVARDHQSIPLTREAVRLLTALPPEMAEEPEVLKALGFLWLAEEQPKNALKFFVEAARKQPNDAVDVLSEAVAYEAEGDEGDAIKTLEHTIQMDPSMQCAYFELARVYTALGQRSAGERVLRRYVELFPESIKGRLQSE